MTVYVVYGARGSYEDVEASVLGLFASVEEAHAAVIEVVDRGLYELHDIYVSSMPLGQVSELRLFD